MSNSNKNMTPDYVYCSGPLFCPEERGGMLAMAHVLEEAGYGTFLPQRDGIEALVMKYVNSPLNINIFKSRNFIDRAIFALDVYQIMARCDYLVFNMNGRVPDEGGVVETALAYAAGKPIVLYKNDARSVFKGRDNSMLIGLSYSNLVRDLKRIPDELKRVSNVLEKLGKLPDQGVHGPPAMRNTINLGQKIWQIMESMKFQHHKKKSGSDLVEEISLLCENHPEIMVQD
ncbi:nucleoside 2-deoxyribosyltransferase [candidate division CSSED10-310 bacterium]|uniref:Nucleoside 2-deoxyribosyltransferase n=1 Tax=candidate division CSSED10-310 bacterium TaxID=2855610 RepID=A0ABV6Z179_UNCC1